MFVDTPLLSLFIVLHDLISWTNWIYGDACGLGLQIFIPGL